MARTVAIGHQDFETIRKNDFFYIDKTFFIREWWDGGDSVTLITRPRRFGKTLTMSMVEQFFSVEYAGREDLFRGLAIWENRKYRELQGTYPVISLSFANVKESSFSITKKRIGQILAGLYNRNRFLLDADLLTDEEKRYFLSIEADMDEVTATMAIHRMSDFLCRYYGKKVIILMDEYDTPMQEAYVYGYWDKLVSYMRSMLNATFKTNPCLERAIMTGITAISKESIFSEFVTNSEGIDDLRAHQCASSFHLNNLKMVTATSEEYNTAFGFTENEVFHALDEYGLSDKKQDVKLWYDGFTFGGQEDIYNPWSIINYLDTEKLQPYWANTSANSLIGKLLREGSPSIKETFEELLRGGTLTADIDEQIVYSQLDRDEEAVWGLMLASGYLKVVSFNMFADEYAGWVCRYVLAITNLEVKIMFRNMIRSWFGSAAFDYNCFSKALLMGDVKTMNEYMNRVALETFSYFDSGKRPSGSVEPERFYHGFVLGMIVDLAGRYAVTPNRESGFGRYDVMLEPLKKEDNGIILEFKVMDPEEENSLEETAQAAIMQIKERNYAALLKTKGIPKEKIQIYGFAFQGKKVLIKKGSAH